MRMSAIVAKAKDEHKLTPLLSFLDDFDPHFLSEQDLLLLQKHRHSIIPSLVQWGLQIKIKIACQEEKEEKEEICKDHMYMRRSLKNITKPTYQEEQLDYYYHKIEKGELFPIANEKSDNDSNSGVDIDINTTKWSKSKRKQHLLDICKSVEDTANDRQFYLYDSLWCGENDQQDVFGDNNAAGVGWIDKKSNIALILVRCEKLHTALFLSLSCCAIFLLLLLCNHCFYCIQLICSDTDVLDP